MASDRTSQRIAAARPWRLQAVVSAAVAVGLLAVAAAWLSRGRGGGGVVVPPLRIDLGRVAPWDVELLPGVGPTLAARLYEVGRRGTPRGIEDLDAVPRMGAGALARVEPWLVFAAPGTSDPGGVTPVDDALYAAPHD